MNSTNLLTNESLTRLNYQVQALLSVIRAEREPKSEIANDFNSLRSHTECMDELKARLDQLISRVIEQQYEIERMENLLDMLHTNRNNIAA